MGAHSHYDVFKSDKDGKWYWHLIGKNGEIQDRSSEGYETEEHAKEGVASAKASSQEAAEVEGEREY